MYIDTASRQDVFFKFLKSSVPFFLQKVKMNFAKFLEFLSPKNFFLNLFASEDSKRETIKCFHGLRVISALLIVFLHSNYCRVLPFVRDYPLFEEWKKTWWAQTVSQFNFFVDVFFVMTAVLSTRSMLKDFRK